MKKLMVVLLIVLFESIPAFATETQMLEQIISGIEKLEGDKDPKCYATASRLEDFMYGTPLTDPARFQKNKLQKRLAEIVWRASGKTDNSRSSESINVSFNKIITFSVDDKHNNLLTFPNKAVITIRSKDLRQYGAVAYSLRAILAAQQDSMMDPDAEMLSALSSDAIETLTQKLDLATLALLQEADAYARAHSLHEIDLNNINRAWLALFQLPGADNQSAEQPEVIFSKGKPPLLEKIIQQKINSYAAYNEISNTLLIRNMQVYFARLSWPKDESEAAAFKSGFIEALIGYAIELYKGVVDVAAVNGHKVVGEQDVARFVMHFTPYTVNEYEDVVFFPQLPGDTITIESYDLDAFRDSGIHWLYLGHALESREIINYLDADPFAAELLAENIAQFGVLLLREAGLAGIEAGKERLSLELLSVAIERIQSKIKTSLNSPDTQAKKATIHSAVNIKQKEMDNKASWFSDITQSVGIDSMHRSSSWLNRLLRAYLRRDDTTGIITIPPAFGGSGVAVGDLNNDNYPDILLLSGLGNKLYLNNTKGQFKDVTSEAGIAFSRTEDNRAGEPRQPLIVDLNNDGWQDIVITYVDDDHRVYKNNGDGSFTDMTSTAALGGKGLVGGPATVFDYDNDGLLDIYITYFGDYINAVLPTLSRINNNGLPNKLFKNTGNFNFVEVDAGVAGVGWTQAVTHTDLNLDDLQDLIVGNDFGSNVYYLNLGNGRFVDKTKEMGLQKPSYTMGIGLADLNADLIPDIYISNIVTMNKDEKYVLPNADTQMKFNLEKLANLRVVEANDLFMSSKDKQQGISYSLNRELVGRGYNSTGWSWGAGFFDADNDGDDDLYVLNGMNEFNLYSSKNAYADASVKAEDNLYLPVDTQESNVFFINSGGKLNNKSAQSGLGLLSNSRSAAYLDFDNDGDLDIIINNYHQLAYFYQNNAERLDAHWIKIQLQGDPSQGINLDAIGAKIIFTLADGSTIWREIRGGEGYMSMHERVVHAGLGENDRVDVEIIWPGGVRQSIKRLKANRLHKIITPGVDN